MSNIEMISVESSNVSKVGYDETAQILRVQFLNGSIYDYYNVPFVEFKNLRTASSVGSYLNKNIKGTYNYKKIG